MKCKYCGEIVNNTAKFCPECGRKLNDYQHEELDYKRYKLIKCYGCGRPIPVDMDKCIYCNYNYDGMKRVVGSERPDGVYTRCPDCGAFNEEGQRTCRRCGYEYEIQEYLSQINKYVSETNLINFKKEICPYCGSKNTEKITVRKGPIKLLDLAKIALIGDVSPNSEMRSNLKISYVCNNCGHKWNPF